MGAVALSVCPHLRVWGSKCYALVPSELRDKLGDRALVCMLLGYSDRSKAYIVMELRTRRVIVSPQVVFDESSMPLVDARRVGALRPLSEAEEKSMLRVFDEPTATPTSSLGPDPSVAWPTREDVVRCLRPPVRIGPTFDAADVVVPPHGPLSCACTSHFSK